MMKQPHLSVSLVIPVYNEGAYIENCLRAALAQTIPFHEIIVVDNNSTDSTAAIVRRFPSVTLVREPRQGVVYARDTGFNAVNGDIIARIDGDTLLTPNWVETVQRKFVDPQLDAVSGSVRYREICARRAFDALDLAIRRYLAHRMSRVGEHLLHGANMAIRKKAWLAVRSSMCHDRQLHEDLDLAVHAARLGQNIAFNEDLVAEVSVRQANANLSTFRHYFLGSPRTYEAHDGVVSYRFMYPIVWIIIALYVPIRLAHRAYHPVTGRFSLRYLFSPPVTTSRPSPIATSLTALE